MFEMLKERFVADCESRKENTKFFIQNGYCESWAEENKKFSDDGIRRYSTERRWQQYTAGEITREKAIEYAIKRSARKYDKKVIKGLDQLLKVAKAPELTNANISVEYRKSSTWGHCPAVEVCSDNGITSGYASGCGYDKESAAVAQAFNKNYSFLKVLYTLKEEGLKNGVSDYSSTACTNVDNRDIIGYGSGYSVLPYFEGGVGVNCFWNILEKAGYTITSYYGKNNNFYSISR